MEFEEDLAEPEKPRAIKEGSKAGKKQAPEVESEEEDDVETKKLLEAAAKEDEKLAALDSVLGPDGEKKTRGVGSFPPERKTGRLKNSDEYAGGDTSDEEDIRNTVGNIPMHWYDEYKHIGYDWDGNRLIKPPKMDTIDEFLKRMEDPNFWRTVKDPQTGQNVVLSDEDVGLIKRIMAGRNPDQQYNDYEVSCDCFRINIIIKLERCMYVIGTIFYQIFFGYQTETVPSFSSNHGARL